MKSQIFSTAADSQPSVDIHIVQGERSLVRDNKSLGTFTLNGIKPAPRGVPQIEVAFDVDVNGMLAVTAKEQATNTKQSITITGASTLPKEEVERMVKEAELNAKLDKEKENNIGIKNNANAVLYNTKYQLDQLGTSITKDRRQKIETLLDKLKVALETDDISLIKSLSDEIIQI